MQAIDIVLQFQEKKENSYDVETIRRTFEDLDTSKDGKISKRKKNIFYNKSKNAANLIFRF